MIHFVVPAAHDRLVREYLEHWGLGVASRMRVVHAESFAAMTRFPRGTYVLAALDQHARGMAAFVEAVHRAIAPEPNVRFLNHPTRALQRFALLDELHRTGHNVFRAVRVTDDLAALRYPVFIRDESNHNGAISPLLQSVKEVQAAVGRAMVQGHAARNLMVVEFCDTTDTEGYYRKYSAFVVGSQIIPRYLSFSREWMLKFQGSMFSPAMAQAECDYMLANPHEAELRQIFQLARIDYGRIDYGLKDGRLQTWEINLNPTIGRGLRKSSGRIPPEVHEIRKTSKEFFYRRFREAWEEVDLGVEEEPMIVPDLDASLARAALQPDSEHNAWLSALRRVIRPARPLLDPIVARALPVIGRAFIRRSS